MGLRILGERTQVLMLNYPPLLCATLRVTSVTDTRKA